MLVLISALLLFGSSAPARAATEAACSHNGARSNGVCKCRHGWTGESCQTLHVGKVDKTKWGYNQLGAPNPAGSWGGGVLQDDAGTWHMWVSENANRCGMNSWGGNSQIVHASSVVSHRSLPFFLEKNIVFIFSNALTLYLQLPNVLFSLFLPGA